MKKIFSIFLICLIGALPIFLNACATALDVAGWVYSGASAISVLTLDTETSDTNQNQLFLKNQNQEQEKAEIENIDKEIEKERAKLTVPKLQIQKTSF